MADVPAKDWLSFNYDLAAFGISEATIRIYDTKGQILTEFVLTDPKGIRNFDTSQLTEGIYFYDIVHQEEVQRKTKVCNKVLSKLTLQFHVSGFHLLVIHHGYNYVCIVPVIVNTP